jgi:hypothetical protein
VRAWPDVLPGPSHTGYELSPADQSIRTDMEVGATRVRRITQARRDLLSLPFRFTDTEYATFRAWYGDELWSVAGDSDSLESWTLTAVTRSADAVAGPDLGVLADTILETTANSAHRVNLTIGEAAPANTVMVLHATIKAAGRNRARLSILRRDGSSPGATVDLTTGLVTTTSGLAATAVVTNRGNGWYRVRIEVDMLSGGSSPQMRVFCALDDNTTSYAGNASLGISVCEVSARVKSATGDLHLRTDATGRALGAAGGSAYFFNIVALGGGTTRAEMRFTQPWRVETLPGYNWQVTAPVEVRNA